MLKIKEVGIKQKMRAQRKILQKCEKRMFEKVVIPFETGIKQKMRAQRKILQKCEKRMFEKVVIPFETVFRISLIIRDLSIRPKLKGFGLLEQGSWA